MASRQYAHFEAVLFDFHDTLFYFQSDSAWLRASAAACGLPMTDAQADALAARIANARLLPEVLALEQGQDLSPAAHRKATYVWLRSAGLADSLADALYENLASPTSWQPFADTAAVLRTLHHAGIAIGILSNIGWNLHETFTHHAVHDYVQAFTLSCEIGLRKPDSAIFDHACAALGAAPGSTLMVGDNPATDGGCVAAGLSGYLLPHPCGAPLRGLSAVLRLVGVAAGEDETTSNL